MDFSHKEFLVQLGLIMETQYHNQNLNNYQVSLGGNDFKIVNTHNYAWLSNKNNGLFLYSSNNTIDFVKETNTELFFDNSKFTLLNDEVCCSIFPYNNYNYILCLHDNHLKLKKILSCLHDNIVTIFKIDHEVLVTKPVAISKPKVVVNNDHLVKLNHLTQSISNNINYLTIATNYPKHIPQNIEKFNYYSYNPNTPISITYLDFIINNYGNFTESVLFIDDYYKQILEFNLEKKILYGPPHNIITHIDTRITLDGLRYKYKKDNIWSEWKDITDNYGNHGVSNKIVFFIKKYIRKMPKTRYLEYSSNSFYFIPSDLILKQPIIYYKNILNYLDKNLWACGIMDKCWYYIFSN